MHIEFFSSCLFSIFLSYNYETSLRTDVRKEKKINYVLVCIEIVKSPNYLSKRFSHECINCNYVSLMGMVHCVLIVPNPLLHVKSI